MIFGLLSGILWGLDTVILGIALTMLPFRATGEAIFLAPFVSTFLHDLFSSLWMLLYMGAKGKLHNILEASKTRSGKFIILAALMGGPIGMSGYVLAIKYIGPAYTAIISSLYPAIGAVLSYIFLREKMKPLSVVGLIISICGIITLGYSPEGEVKNLALGFMFAIICVIGWSSEAVISSYGMKDEEIDPEQALQIRQLTTAIVYGFIIIPILSGIKFTINAIPNMSVIIILFSALSGTASYIFYYKGIHKIGATKAMSLNITYSSWAIVFGLLLLGSSIDIKSIICSVIIIIGSILAAGDLSEIKCISIMRYNREL